MIRVTGRQGPAAELPAVFATLFYPDVTLHQAEATGTALPPQARLYRAVVDDALHDLAYPPQSVARRQALDWIRDCYGQEARYSITFTTAIERGYVGLDPEVLARKILAICDQGAFDRRQLMHSRSAGKHHGGHAGVSR